MGNPIEFDAGDVSPGDQEYVVAFVHEHDSLEVGDMVRVREFGITNVIVRSSDGTIHSVKDGAGQYVHLRRPEDVDPDKLAVWTDGDKPASAGHYVVVTDHGIARRSAYYPDTGWSVTAPNEEILKFTPYPGTCLIDES